MKSVQQSCPCRCEGESQFFCRLRVVTSSMVKDERMCFGVCRTFLVILRETKSFTRVDGRTHLRHTWGIKLHSQEMLRFETPERGALIANSIEGESWSPRESEKRGCTLEYEYVQTTTKAWLKTLRTGHHGTQRSAKKSLLRKIREKLRSCTHVFSGRTCHHRNKIKKNLPNIEQPVHTMRSGGSMCAILNRPQTF